jgi:hypothetical protein
MKTAVQLCALVTLAVGIQGQVPPGSAPAAVTATRIGPHLLGETFSEWLGIQKIDLDRICKNHDNSGPSVTADPASLAEWVKCDSLTPISVTGKGYFWATSEDFKWTFTVASG